MCVFSLDSVRLCGWSNLHGGLVLIHNRMTGLIQKCWHHIQVVEKVIVMLETNLSIELKYIYIIWSNNKPTIKTFVSRQLSLTLHVGTKEMSNHQINQILTQHSPPSPHLSAVDREEERRASCESCCGYGAVSLAKQALPSLMCCFKARFLRALPAILIWEHVFEVREGGADWSKRRLALPYPAMTRCLWV